MGTAAHSWVMSFDSETEAFRELQRAAGRPDRAVDRYLRSDRRRACRRRARQAAVGRAHRQRRFLALVAPGPPDSRRRGPAGREDHGERRSGRIEDRGASCAPARRSTHSAWAPNWRLRPTRLRWAAIYKLVEIEQRRRDPLHREEQPRKEHARRAQSSCSVIRISMCSALHDECAARLGSDAEAGDHRGQADRSAAVGAEIRDRAQRSDSLAVRPPPDRNIRRFKLARSSAGPCMKAFFDIDTQIDFVVPGRRAVCAGRERVIPAGGAR